MNAGELIELLKTVPPDTPILRVSNIGGYSPLTFHVGQAHYNDTYKFTQVWPHAPVQDADIDCYGPVQTAVIAKVQ